jgi:hypothetical protein
MGALDSLNDITVYDRKTRATLNEAVDAKLRRTWFANYERNKKDIEASGGINGRMPSPLETVIVVGAGWTLKKNVHLLASVPDVPVITCDKAAPVVAKYVTPLAICALNTDKTDIKLWLKDFYEVMERRGADPSEVWLVVPVTVNPEVFEQWKGKVAFVNPQNTCEELTMLVLAETGIPPTQRGDNVGFFGCITAVMLGAKKVIMLGMTYSYEKEDEARRVNSWAHVCINDIRDIEVYTVLGWLDVRTEFIDFCMDVIDDVRFINCSEGGILYQENLIDALDFKVWIRFWLEQKNKAKRTKARPRDCSGASDAAEDARWEGR